MIARGQIHWAKILGEPVPAFDRSKPNEWCFDLSIDDKTVKLFKDHDLNVKNKGDDKGNFITFRRPSVKKDGTPAKRIEVVDANRKPWDPNVLIGNGSTVNVMFLFNDYPGPGGKTKYKASVLKVQVVELVDYEGGEREDFPQYNENGEEEWT